eukprot:gene16648-5245_t
MWQRLALDGAEDVAEFCVAVDHDHQTEAQVELTFKVAKAQMGGDRARLAPDIALALTRTARAHRPQAS